MKKSKLALLLGTLLSLFVLAGCPSPAGSGGDTVTITFNDNGNVTKTVTLASGSSLSSLSSNQLPNNPSKMYNYFMYWSESKASQAAAVKFDYNKEITSNITLYAIYTPELSHSNAISKLTDSTIEIQLWDPKVYPLEDGSYAGLQILYSTDGYEYQDFGLTIPSAYKDSAFRYLTYTFSNTLSNGKYYFKVTNGYETGTKEITVTSNFQDPKTVTFDDNGSKRTITIESGSKVTKPSNPSKSGNTFLYWSNSKTSLADVAEFDFNTAITDDITLYAIYTPTFYNNITSLSSTTVEIQLYSSTLYPLEDGSFAGIKALHSTNNKDYENYPINNVPNTDRAGYLKYTFTTPLSAGDHYIKVTNGIKETYEKTVSVIEPAPVSNLIADTDDSYVKVSFTTVKGYDSYTVQVFKGSSEIASKTISSYTTPSSRNVEFFGLDNGTEYTFKVLTDGTNKSAEITATPEIKQKESDWLLVMYMDGDNNLHHPIFIDMNEVEYGLYQIRSSDGTADSAHDSVNVVALWDGAVSWEDEDDNGNPITVTPQIGETGSYIFELGSDSGCTTTYTTSTGCVLSSNTKNLSYTAPWLVGSNNQVSTTQPTSCGEVNMGNKQTLINFLNWVKEHYTAKKGVILQFSDHGGGPRNQMYLETADGKTLKLSDDRRALCWDESSSSDFLKTKDVSDALSAVGYGASNKLSMILMDVCLGSSFEDAYQFKNYAGYLAASPNNIPGNGLDYTALMKSFNKNTTIDAIGKQMVADYKKQYGGKTAFWNSYTQNASNYDYYSSLNDNQKYNLEWQGHLGMTTFTITDLNEVDKVKTKIDSLCEVLLSPEGKAKKVKLASNGVISPTDTSNEADYVKYLMRYTNAEKLFVTNNTSTQYYIDDSIYYMGSYVWLYDIGYIADMMKYCSATSINGTTNVNAWSELYTAADDVITALGQAVKYSWRDSMLNDSNDFYSLIEGSSTNASTYNHYYGLTIGGAGFATVSKKIVQGKLPDWYMTDLEFGKKSKWSELLSYWFGVQE